MPETPPHRPTQIAETQALALPYESRKRVHHANDMMARITAEPPLRHLAASQFERPSRAALGASVTDAEPSGPAKGHRAKSR